MAGNGISTEGSEPGHQYPHGDGDSDRDLCPHGHFLHLFDDPAAGMAQHDLRTVFCRGSHLLWNCSTDDSHDDISQGVSPGDVPERDPFPLLEYIAVDHVADLVLLHLLRVSDGRLRI